MGTMKGGVLSPTSTCHTFDTSADGYGRAEGVNAIYIKRLSSALKHGNRIRSIIRGTAINASVMPLDISCLNESATLPAKSQAGKRGLC